MTKQSTQLSSSRGAWASRFGAIMSMAAMAVGLGNVWRFPYLVGTYGGGAFVFAYLVCLFIIVLPLCLVECALGKGLQAGCLDAWTKVLHNEKAGKIVGSICSLGYGTMNFYFMFVLAGSIYFIYSFATDLKTRMNPELIYDFMQTEQTGIMLAITAVVTIAMLVIVYMGIEAGIEKVSRFMMPAIFVIFFVVIFFSAFSIPNIIDGYNFYLNPDWKQLASPSMWKQAAGQACFSVGVGPGCILVYGSHIKKYEDVTLSMTTVAIIDTAIALLAGFAIIPTCVAMGLDPQSGAGLIFIVLPTALAQIPFGNILGILAMIAIFFAGFTSAIAQLEVAVTSFSDGLKMFRKPWVLGLGALTMVMALVCVVVPSQFDFWNNFSGNYVFIVTAGMGAICFNYVYGTKRIRLEYMNPGSDIQIGAWFDPLVRFISVPLMIIVMADSLFPFLP